MFIASNTSSFSISRLSEHVRHPAKFLGMHFFYPADKRELVEVVHGKATGAAVANEAVSFLRRIGKIPIIVKDGPGFLVNRIVIFYLNEAVNCLADGMQIEELDRMMVNFGMPVGPFSLMDLVGIELSYTIGKNVAEGLNSPRLKISPVVINLYDGYRSSKNICWYIDQGEKRVPNQGLYELLEIKRQKTTAPREHYLNRIVYTIINEASRCLEEGLVSEPELVDLGLTLGMGFPYGGPLSYADSVGLSKIVDSLDSFKQMHGERFTCSGLLRDMAEANKNFYTREQTNTKP